MIKLYLIFFLDNVLQLKLVFNGNKLITARLEEFQWHEGEEWNFELPGNYPEI